MPNRWPSPRCSPRASSVRITGQDAERGTFSHRQAVLHDVNTGELFTPLANLPQATGAFEIYNSPLSETAVLGFEYGFSVAAPDELVLWEAQYGDFANVAQPIIDQFISAGRAKWQQESGLVLLLPHGYEGQGPGALERASRALSAARRRKTTWSWPIRPRRRSTSTCCAGRRMRRPRRPLVLMQPKSAAAHARCGVDARGSDDRHVQAGDRRSRWRRRIATPCSASCSAPARSTTISPAAERPANVAMIRVEELAPWPREIGALVDQYPNVEEVVWAQEEPKNMGAWTYVQPRLRASIGTRHHAALRRPAGAVEPRRGLQGRRTTSSRRASSRTC